MTIFTEGILYPQLILGFTKNNPTKTKSEIDSMSNEDRFKYYMSKNDTLTISNFKELKFLNTSPKTKRFRFWHYMPGIMNPQAYFIEITNDSATTETDIETFIKGSELTFLKAGWIII